MAGRDARPTVLRDRGQRLRAESTDEQCKDGLRTAYLNQHGYRVLRFWNEQINTELEGVLAKLFMQP
jgi:hypothetical protein